MTTFGLKLPNPLKPTWKCSNGKSHPTRPQMLRRPIITCSRRWHIEKWLDSWIASKDEHFYRNGIRALLERWAKVVANDGQYFE